MAGVLAADGAERGWWRLPLVAGVLLGVSYLPGPFLVLNFTAFLPLVAWLDAHASAPARRLLAAGFVFGLAAELVMLHFMYAMLAWSWLAAVLYLGMSAGIGLRIAASILLLGWLRRRTGQSWGLLLPLCWLPGELLQSCGDLRMTGDQLAHSVAGYPFLVQFADLVGPFGVGGFVVAANGLLADVLIERGRPASRRAAIVLAALFAAVLGYDGWAWMHEAAPGAETVRVAIVQPNIPLEVKHRGLEPEEQRSILAELSTEAAGRGAELIVWPETARPEPLRHRLERAESFAMPEVQTLARRLGVPMLVGVEYYRIGAEGEERLYNAAIAVDARGRLSEQWGAKVYLVPFVEAMPFKPLLEPLVAGRGGEWRWISGGFDSGPTSALIDLAGAKVGVLVCYEELFADLARRLRNAGAELQVVITNDAWFGRSLFQPYLANALRLRAIENRTAFVRVANTGISGFVDRRGRYHDRTALFERAVEVHEVERNARRTVYDRVGDLVAWLAVAGLAAAVVAARGGSRRGAL